MASRIIHKTGLFGLVLSSFLIATGCRQDMHDQPRFEPLEANNFFSDGRAARPLVTGVVARGTLQEDAHLFTGRVNDEFVTTFPFTITQDVIVRGQERYNIFCSPCHGALGDGEGAIVQRGLKHPPSYHIDRLREAPVGYYFNVITNGFGAMFDYADRVSVRDRWAIIAYIRALQLSQNAKIDDVPAEARQQLDGTH
ncbi:MAG: cytochrome c [Deltaproteobacteria bacterium]|nr:cytochrome c [Deltaproteobacteria bacterium]